MDLVSTDFLNAFHYRAHNNIMSIVLDKCAGVRVVSRISLIILCIIMTFTLTNGSKRAGESIGTYLIDVQKYDSIYIHAIAGCRRYIWEISCQFVSVIQKSIKMRGIIRF